MDSVKDFDLIQLNGIAGFLPGNQAIHEHANIEFDGKDKWPVLEKLFASNNFNRLAFGWESSEILEYAKYNVTDVSIIVVIGYSFPFFNRNIDKAIFEVIKASQKLRKIYFQDPYLDGSFLRSQFGLYGIIEIEHIKRVDSFYIPFEL